MLAIEAGFADPGFWLGCCLGSRSSIKYATNVIADGTTKRSAERFDGPATLHKLPNFISHLRSLAIFRSLWSEMVVHDKVAKF